MTKTKTLEELQDEFNSLTKKRMQLILDLDKLTKELNEIAEKVFEKSPEYVKINCLRCNGEGILKTDEGKKVKCDVCGMKKYIWVKKYQEVEESNGN